MMRDPLIPAVGVVTRIRVDTPDVKTFRVVGADGQKPFVHIPGQCAMLSVPGVGEALFSITSSPTEPDFIEFSIKKCGCVTDWLHAMEEGQQVTIKDVPLRLHAAGLEDVVRDGSFEVRGEGYMPKSSFETLNAAAEKNLRNGNPVSARLSAGRVRLYGESGAFLALGEGDGTELKIIKRFYEV